MSILIGIQRFIDNILNPASSDAYYTGTEELTQCMRKVERQMAETEGEDRVNGIRQQLYDISNDESRTVDERIVAVQGLLPYLHYDE